MKGEEEGLKRIRNETLARSSVAKYTVRNAEWNRDFEEMKELRKKEEERIKNMLKKMTRKERKAYLAVQERLLREKEAKAKAEKEKAILDQQRWQEFLQTPEGQSQMELEREAEAANIAARNGS